MQTLLLAHKRKRISGICISAELYCKIHSYLFLSKVFVTEARPRGLGYATSIIYLLGARSYNNTTG